jgi:hypothetical protein
MGDIINDNQINGGLKKDTFCVPTLGKVSPNQG